MKTNSLVCTCFAINAFGFAPTGGRPISLLSNSSGTKYGSENFCFTYQCLNAHVLKLQLLLQSNLWLRPTLVSDHLSSATENFQVSNLSVGSTGIFLKLTFCMNKTLKHGISLCSYHMLMRKKFDLMWSKLS